MKKTEIVFRAIVRAGLNPLEFNIYPSLFGQPVIIERRDEENNIARRISLSDAPVSITTLEIHPDDGIKRIAEQIKEKFSHQF